MPHAELQPILEMIRSRPFSATATPAQLRARIDKFSELFPLPAGLAAERTELGGVPAERIVAAANGPTVLYLHGGGYVAGSPVSHRHVAGRLANDIGGTVYALDYRLAPEAPFPAALDDALAAYRALLALVPAARIAIAGDSAGGGLTFATAVGARSQGLAKPGCLVGISPWVSLGTQNESYDKLAKVDPMLSREVCEFYASRYLAGKPHAEPLASPLNADLNGLSPVLIQVGDHECFLGDAVAMHQSLIAAGVDTRLTVWKEMIHVWHLYWPMLAEGRAAIAEVAQFVTRHTAA